MCNFTKERFTHIEKKTTFIFDFFFHFAFRYFVTSIVLSQIALILISKILPKLEDKLTHLDLCDYFIILVRCPYHSSIIYVMCRLHMSINMLHLCMFTLYISYCQGSDSSRKPLQQSDEEERLKVTLRTFY